MLYERTQLPLERLFPDNPNLLLAIRMTNFDKLHPLLLENEEIKQPRSCLIVFTMVTHSLESQISAASLKPEYPPGSSEPAMTLDPDTLIRIASQRKIEIFAEKARFQIKEALLLSGFQPEKGQPIENPEQIPDIVAISKAKDVLSELKKIGNWGT